MFNVKETGLNFEVVNRKSWMIYCNNLLQELTKPVNPKLQIYHNVDIRFKLAAITVHRRGNNVFYITGKHWSPAVYTQSNPAIKWFCMTVQRNFLHLHSGNVSLEYF